MPTVTVHQAKINLSRLIAAALGGQEVVIAKGRTPIVRLVPFERIGPRRPGSLKGRLALTADFFQPLPDDDLESWEAGRGEG